MIASLRGEGEVILERRLAAILAADVVGYTRLMGADEAGTLERLTELRKAILEPLIDQHHGRIVKLMGDGLLVEFASVVEALACAVAWQDGVAAQEAVVDDDTRLTSRIGINLGDVIVEGDDIHGDGVNIAARLEGLAEPGGICLSGDAYRQAKGRLKVAFEDMGEQDLKNVAEPVRVYRVTAGRSATTAPPPKTKARPLPERPSVAVLPFEELGGDPGQSDFSDGLAADIITELSRSGTISVIGRHESQSHGLQNATVQEVGRVLSVRYVLSGTIRRAGERGRITAELLEVGTGRPRWTERYDRSLDDPFAAQDELARAIVGVVEPTLSRAEMDRISRSPAKDLQAHELMLRAWSLSDQGYEEGNRAAQRDCEEAIRLDPHYSDAHSQLAWILYYAAWNGWTEDPEGSLRRALDCAERASSLNPKDYDALGIRGALLISLGRYDAAERIVEDLAKKFPGHGRATMYQSNLLSSLGRHEEALALAQNSMDINPEHDQWHWLDKGMCLFCLERYAEAIDALERFKTLSKFPFARLVLAAAYAAAGREEEAQAEAASLGTDAGKLITGVNICYRDPADRERLVMWARRAGLPE
jgi:class 3 adenylate cyclase